MKIITIVLLWQLASMGIWLKTVSGFLFGRLQMRQDSHVMKRRLLAASAREEKGSLGGENHPSAIC